MLASILIVALIAAVFVWLGLTYSRQRGSTPEDAAGARRAAAEAENRKYINDSGGI